MIQLDNISKAFHTKQGAVLALSDISLSVGASEIMGVIGKSGAGKSTLIRCVNLLERPDHGSVRVNNQNLMRLSNHDLRLARHRIGMIFQHFNLLNTRTVYDNVAFPLQLIGKNKRDIKTMVMPLLELTGMIGKANAYPAELSGGQKQRVGIARALATKPSVLLCDEMTSALDPETTQVILQLIKKINREFKLSVLLITHEMTVIKAIADRVAVLDHGRIIEQNDVLNLFKNPKHALTQSLTQASVGVQLPEVLQMKIKQTPIADGLVILRLRFIGKAAAEPMIHDLIKKFDVEVNIIEAHLELLHRETIGTMLIAMQAQLTEVGRSIIYLKAKQLQVEVLGYVDRHDWLNR